MTDDDLRRALAASPPPAPDAAARQRALAAALSAFDEAAEGGQDAPGAAVDLPTSGDGRPSETSGARQGKARQARPSDRRSRLAILGRLRMTTARLPSARTLMLGTASVAVLMLAVVTSTELLDRDAAGPTPRLVEPKRADGGAIQTPADQALRDESDSLAAEPERVPSAKPVPPPLPQVRNEALSAPASVAGQSVAKSTATVAESRADRPATLQRGVSGAPALAPSAGGWADAAAPVQAEPVPSPGWHEQGRDRFADIEANGIKVTAEEPVSTFSIDVDTASYSFVRRALMEGVLPPKDAVRVEELVNYFPYGYAPPDDREAPFAAHVAVMPTPWNDATKLVRIGIKGYDIAPAERPRANLVFLIDSSGSMDAPDKLPLLVNSFRLLVDSLSPDDTVAIVAYAGSAGTVLEPTKVRDKARILGALERLRAGGSTAGGEGIRQAYRLAEENLDPNGVNRVILATDGDFNVGITSTDELQDFVERERESGVYLSVLGFGRGNLNDALMQALAQNGNGEAAYIDTLAEARKALVEEASSTLFPIADDVKIQVEFNPATVAEYRLVGYETRLLAREDFNNDKVDAGEIGAGHSVTALYEITPAGSESRAVDPLRYGQAESAPAAGASDEYAFLKIRYKLPGEKESRLISRPISRGDEGAADADARFAAAVAAFGQLLRGGEHLGGFGYDDVVRLANGARGDDPYGYRAEFVTLARLAASAASLEPQRR